MENSQVRSSSSLRAVDKAYRPRLPILPITAPLVGWKEGDRCGGKRRGGEERRGEVPVADVCIMVCSHIKASMSLYKTSHVPTQCVPFPSYSDRGREALVLLLSI